MDWKGWALGNSALYIARQRGSDHVGLYIQYDNEPHQVGIFLDEDVARETQAWLEAAISATALANAELAGRIEELTADQHG